MQPMGTTDAVCLDGCGDLVAANPKPVLAFKVSILFPELGPVRKPVPAEQNDGGGSQRREANVKPGIRDLGQVLT
jgi:hypothetical protein